MTTHETVSANTSPSDPDQAEVTQTPSVQTGETSPSLYEIMTNQESTAAQVLAAHMLASGINPFIR